MAPIIVFNVMHGVELLISAVVEFSSSEILMQQKFGNQRYRGFRRHPICRLARLLALLKRACRSFRCFCQFAIEVSCRNKCRKARAQKKSSSCRASIKICIDGFSRGLHHDHASDTCYRFRQRPPRHRVVEQTADHRPYELLTRARLGLRAEKREVAIEIRGPGPVAPANIPTQQTHGRRNMCAGIYPHATGCR